MPPKRANDLPERQDFDETMVAFGALIRRLRQEKGMSLETLAKAAGISTGALSQIERGRGNPSLRTVTGLRMALNADVGDLFSDAPRPVGKGSDPDFVTRAGGRPRLELGYVSKQLLSHGNTHGLNFMILEVAPQAGSTGKPLSYPAEKGGLVLSGQLVLRVGDEVAHLFEGDSFTIDYLTPHSFQNPTDEIAKILWIMGAINVQSSL